MSDQSNNNSAGGGFMALLAVLFIGLKLTGYITWSWWWVLAPLWGPAAALLCIAIVIGVFGIVKTLLN